MERSRSDQEKLNEDLYWACVGGDLKCVQDLLRDGADPLWKHPVDGWICLHRAALHGGTEIVKYLLDNSKLLEHIDVVDDHLMTPCHWAAINDNLDMVKLLVNHGANRHIKDKHKMTPLDCAKKWKKSAVMNYLEMLDAQDAQDAENALQLAMKEGIVKVNIIKILIIGPPGSGKTCTKHLLLGIPPPGKRSSTPIATRVARAISLYRFKADGSEVVYWNEMDNDTYLKFIAEEVKLLKLISAPSMPVPDIVTATTKCTVEPPDIESNTGLGKSETPIVNTNEGMIVHILKDVLCEKTPSSASEQSQPRRFIHLIDSGGQPSFLSLVPAFVRGCTVNIVVSKLSSRLSEHLPFEYVIDDQHLRQPTDLSQSQLELIEELICSISSVIYSKNTHSNPKFLIIGTHADKHWPVFMETLTSKCQQIKQKLGRLQDMCIDCHPYGDIIFPVDTLTTKNRDDISNFIRQKIMNAHGSAGEIEIPTRWYVFELEFNSMAKKEGRGVLSLMECFEIGRKLGMGEKDVDAALGYLNEAALCLYFKEAVPHLVFPDPQAILNELTELMNIGIIDLKHIPSHYPVRAVKRLRNEGLLNKILVDIMCCKFRVNESKCSYTVEDFLAILEHLFIVVRLIIEGEELFFLPAILSSVKKMFSFESEELATLCLVCGPTYRDNTIIPLGYFPALVVALLSESTLVRFTLYEIQYRNCVQLLCSDLGGVVQLVDQHTWIEVSYNGNPNFAYHIQLAIHKSTNNVCKQRQLDTGKVVFNNGFRCPFAPKCKKGRHPCTVSLGWLTCCVKPDFGSGKCSDLKMLRWLRAPIDTRTASLREQTPHKPGSSSLAGVTGTPTQNTISQILKKNYIDLHRIISINPTNVAGYFYSAELISNATLHYVTTTVGISGEEKGHKLLQDCHVNIVSHDDPVERVRKLLEILRELEPAAKVVVERINGQLPVTTCCMTQQ